MTRIFLIITFLIAWILEAQAQNITNVNAYQANTALIIKYSINGAKYNQSFDVSVFLSNDGGQTYAGPLKQVAGDVGLIETGGDKEIIWKALEDDFDFSGDLVFDVRMTVNEVPIKNRFFVGYSGNTAAPIGLILGQAGKVGWYVSGRVNTGFFTDVTYETDGNFISNYAGGGYYEFTGQTLITRASFTGGITMRMAKDKVYFYLGGGYGAKSLLWEAEDFSYADDSSLSKDYAEHTEFSYSGAEAEAGLLFNLNKVFIAIGGSTLSGKRYDATFSIGLTF